MMDHLVDIDNKTIYESEGYRDAYELIMEAHLQGVDLSKLSLSHSPSVNGRDFRGLCFSHARFVGCNFQCSDLRGCDFSQAIFEECEFAGSIIDATTKMPPITMEGEIIGYKKVYAADRTPSICKLRIPADVARVRPYSDSKWRSASAIVLEGCGFAWFRPYFYYSAGETVVADSFNPDPRESCSHGIHFFLTREEAKVW